MDSKEVPASESHEVLTPQQHRVEREEADEKETGAAAIIDFTPPKSIILNKEDGDRDEDSIATTAVEREQTPPPDAEAPPARPESPPEEKRSKGRTALIMSALCVWLHLSATQENDS